MHKKIILQANNISKNYKDALDNSINILSNININLYEQESVAIVGSSGSGKSTLLHLLGGLDMPSSGNITFLDKPWGGLDKKQSLDRNKYMGFIYQFHHLIWELTALENAMLPLWIAQGKTHTPSQIKLASELLDKLGLSHRLDNLPSQLSGGERQRVAIARALIHKPLCILADEPTGNLDRKHALNVFDLLQKSCEEYGATLVVVTHDQSIAGQCSRVLAMDNGKLELQ